MIELTDKKLSASLHCEHLEENIHFLQVRPPTGLCQHIKCFLDEPGSCSSRWAYISRAPVTGNSILKPDAFTAPEAQGHLPALSDRFGEVGCYSQKDLVGQMQQEFLTFRVRQEQPKARGVYVIDD